MGTGNLTILKQTVESLVAFESLQGLAPGRCSGLMWNQTTPPRRSQDIECEPRVAAMLRQLLEGRPDVDKRDVELVYPAAPKPCQLQPPPDIGHEWGQILPRDNWRLVPIPLDAHAALSR